MTTKTAPSAARRGKAAASAAEYDSSHIETLRFPESVRRNAEMYLGSTEAAGVFKIAGELLDNAIDEHQAGRNTGVLLFADSDGSYWVQDHGAGIPQGTKTFAVNVNGKMVENSMPTMQAVFGELHTSGKFRSEAYSVSIGTHGIGAKGTNATSEFFEVWTAFKNKWYSIRFERGHLVRGVALCKAPPKGPTGKPLEKGTLIHYKPDTKIFKAKSFPLSLAHEWAELTAYMNPGFSIVVGSRPRTGKPVFKKFYSENGVDDYIVKRLADLGTTAEEANFELHGDLADVVVAFSTFDGCDLRGFTNGLHNVNGGHHVDSVSKALFASISEFKTKRQSFTRRDFDDGLVGIVNAKLHKASFSSQDKAKLTDVRMASEFEASVLEAATKFFRKNKALAGRLCERAARLNELKGKFKASREVTSALAKAKKAGMPPNYAPPHRSVPIRDRELFVVEGDSAAGGFREVREPKHGLLPLSGKIANALKMQSVKTLASAAIISLLSALGYDPRAEDPLKKLQIGKMICMADADSDGCHINSLLLTLIFKLCPEAFAAGIIFVADMPEYIAQHKGKLYTGSTQAEVREKLVAAGVKGVTPKHLKGWGEVDAGILKILAIDPTRKLIQISAVTTEDSVEFIKVMSKDVEARREALGIKEEQHNE